ncbi:MAG: Rne/Rng family ribonuclease [Actinobacteria bacterium]|nr:Rne/Rng family ribonuclease [Actinomycetota bacterium]
MPWFRFRKKEETDGAASTAATPEPAAPEPAVAHEATAAPTDPSKPKRRRGSRGGRGRKKPGTGAAAEAAPGAATTAKAGAAKASATKAPERKQSERKQQLSQRQERRRDQSQRRRQPPRRAPLPDAKRELIVSVDVGEQRVAVLEDGKVAEVYLERPERRSIAGNIYLGVVDNVLPGMEAAFVEIGLEKNGFLYVDEIVGPELEKGHGRKIQDLIKKGEQILVQAVKDPMKTKGARLTTQISLPGRFVVFVPQGEGLGVSRRLEDDERARLKDILRRLDVKEGGVIVRTAAEGASEEDIERDLVFLQRLWKSIQAKAATAKAPELVYQEAELPLRVVRDLFTGDFEKAYVDDDRTYKRITGYLKKTSPHMGERVVRYKDTPPLMEAFGVEAEIKSTLHRRVDLPSGGYLIFDYAEAFTVIDVNTGRFVGSRGKNSGARLEDTITKNNLEAVKEVVRQLRLRDIGGIIVIDFIDMANPKNRATVEEALRSELERDRTKTYVVEISPLGLVEMTRQNVTDGPREVMTRKCPTCGGDGIVYSEASAAIDVERRLRALATGSRSQAFRVELADSIASALVGPGARRLIELEALTKRRFFLEGKPSTHLDHFVVLAEGKLADLAPEAPVAEGAELMLQLVEIDRHDSHAAVGKVDGLDVVVADSAAQVGKRIKIRIERVLDGVAYATPARKAKVVPEPLTAEGEAEKPTRKPPARKAAAVEEAPADATEAVEGDEVAVVEVDEPEALDLDEEELEEAAEDEEDAEVESADGAAPAKKKTRRGSRGGRRRKKKPAVAGEGAEAGAEETQPEAQATDADDVPRSVTIHLPGDDLGREDDEDDEPSAPAAEEAEGEEAPKPRKKTRRGSRGGRRRKKPATAGSTNGSEPEAEGDEHDEPEDEDVAEEPVVDEPESEEPEAQAPDAEETPSQNGDSEQEWGYVPMSEWLDEIDSGR